MARYTFKLTPAVLGLSVLTISPGVTGLGGKENVDPDDRARALVETAVIGLIATHLTKSLWPVTAPFLYLAYNRIWSDMHDVPSQIG